MNDPDEELRKAVALFRYGLIADVLRLPLGSRETRRALHEKAQRTYVIPGTRRTRVAVETMRDWLKPLSHRRVRGAVPEHPRRPRPTSPTAPRGSPKRLLTLKCEQPALSVRALIKAARERGVEHPLAPSTVHRLLCARRDCSTNTPRRPRRHRPASLRLPRRPASCG